VRDDLETPQGDGEVEERVEHLGAATALYVPFSALANKAKSAPDVTITTTRGYRYEPVVFWGG